MIRNKTDSEIRQGVTKELAWEPGLDAGSLAVRVQEGIVTLTGCVPAFGAKRAAVQAARRVPGVRAVVEAIEVRRPGTICHTDADVARAVLDCLSWYVYRPEEKVDVTVEQGWVTLEGEMTDAWRRANAVEAVRRVPGVRGVHDLLTVKPHATPA